ncbi:MAG: DNA cytosine methyltransferase, partial [Chlorobium sp.]|nr:DNA cytosine methyltransferase [Chlorobium sp.]
MKMHAVELFVGAGGLGLGVSNARFKTAAVIDFNRYCCDTIRENQKRNFDPVSKWPLIETDIRKFDFRSLSETIDFISGGPPCQPFSIGGNHKAQSDTRDMFPEAVRSVRELTPRAFLFENVKGLTRASFANYFEYIRLQLTYPELIAQKDEDWSGHLSRLEKHHTQGKDRGLTYRVVTRVLNAANYGVPQKRERVFFVGFRTDLGIEWNFPEGRFSHDALLWDQTKGTYWERHNITKKDRRHSNRSQSRINKVLEPPNSIPWRTVRDALYDLPDPERFPTEARNFLNHRFQPGARIYAGHTGSPLDEPAKTLKAGVHG